MECVRAQIGLCIDGQSVLGDLRTVTEWQGMGSGIKWIMKWCCLGMNASDPKMNSDWRDRAGSFVGDINMLNA
jgi:hypothetical protein